MLKLALFLNFIFISFEAHAYLDPASGSAIIYIFISVFSAVMFFLKDLLIKIRGLFLFVFRKDKHQTKQEHDIVFYSEGGQYWNVFSPIIKELDLNKREVLFLTSDKRDPAFFADFKYLKVNYIGDINLAGIYLKQIRAKFLGMTTPQLDVLTIKRTNKIKHYAHIVHAPVDVATYRKFAFDYFDSVFCSGPHQLSSIRFFEKKRRTHEKKLIEVGCTYYDQMINDLKSVKIEKKDRPTILIAPTWKTYSLVHSVAIDLISNLLIDNKFDVILRPHPQTFISFPDVMKKIENQFKNHPGFTVDLETSGLNSMAKCDLMISDLSGIIWDYVFLFKKPVLLIHKEINLNGFEATEMPFKFWELEALEKVGKIVQEEEVARIVDLVEHHLSISDKLNLDDFRDKSIFNWGNAGRVASENIISIVSSL